MNGELVLQAIVTFLILVLLVITVNIISKSMRRADRLSRSIQKQSRKAVNMSLTLADFEIRYKTLKEKYPDLPKCSVKGCNNPVDITEGLGQDSSCAYHRLLFDWWMGELTHEKIMYYFRNQRARRAAFTRWRNKLGKEACDKIVLKMAQEPINWKC